MNPNFPSIDCNCRSFNMETPRKFKLLHRHRTLTRAAIKIGQSFTILCNDEHEPIQKMNGDEYVDILMEELERCLKMLRMYPDASNYMET